MKPNYILKPAMKILHIEHLKEHQIKPIQSIMLGHDTLIRAATGSGKSIIYTLTGLLHKDKLTLVIEPTLALIYNQVQSLKKLEINAEYIDSTLSKCKIKNILKRVINHKITFLYITPERLQSKEFVKAMQKTDLYMVVVDECHCVSEWGYTFRDAYLKIGDFVDSLSDRPIVCACSATIMDDRKDDICKLLHMNNPQSFDSDLSRKNLSLIKKDVTSNHKSLEVRLKYRFKTMDKYINKYYRADSASVIIYALTTGYVDAIYNHLDTIYPGQVAKCHSKIEPQKLKHQMEKDFLTGKRKIMVASSAFGMGIDVPDVELVIHFNTPISMTDYIQQIGRAGRDGRDAHCVLFYDENGDDERIFQSFYKKAKKESSKAAKVLKENYRQMREFIDSTECMAKDILAIQGQTSETSCKRCTNCAKNRRGNNS